MYAPTTQIQAPDDEDEERNDVVRRCKEPAQGSFLSFYNHSFEKSQDYTVKSVNRQKFIDFACSNAASNPLKISYDRLIQEGFDLASPKTKAKKRKPEALDGGGRVIRAAGRKDRHSKVRTARGPRDRRLRLSPTTAIQFYDVQDRLGCDRPSKAIDWLINEAKAAIDALDEQPQSVKFSDSNAVEAENHGGLSFSQRGTREREEHLNDDGLVSAFSCFVNEAAPPPPPAAAYRARDGSCSAPRNLETNWEMGRLQKMFTWNSLESSSSERGGGGGAYFSGNTLPPHAAAQGHSNLFREPLQSSIMNNDLAGFIFSDELSKIATSAHLQE